MVNRNGEVYYSAGSLFFFLFSFFFFFLLIITKSSRLAEIRWSVCISKTLSLLLTLSWTILTANKYSLPYGRYANNTLSFNFTLWSTATAESTIRHVLLFCFIWFFFFFFFFWLSLGLAVWPRSDDPFVLLLSLLLLTLSWTILTANKYSLPYGRHANNTLMSQFGVAQSITVIIGEIESATRVQNLDELRAFHFALMPKVRIFLSISPPPPTISKQLCKLGSLALVRQPVKIKKTVNSNHL